MNTKTILYCCILSMVMLWNSASAFALPLNHFTTESKLAHGKWAKISVSETGVHEITEEQLSLMGFNDINSVKVFGRGGYVLDEVLTTALPDDLSQVPVTIHNGKIFFYAHGATELQTNTIDGNPYFTGKVNPYSKYGYYFITDSDTYQPLNVADAVTAADTESTTDIEQSYDYVFHNKELFSFLNSGKTFYGENLLEDYELTFKMPHLIANTPVTLAFSIGSNVDASSTVSASINSVDIPLSSNTLSKIGYYHEFEICSPLGITSDIGVSENYSLRIDIEDTGINNARLDCYSVSYIKRNEFPADSTQMRMILANSDTNKNIIIKNTQKPVIVWDVTTGSPKSQYILDGKDSDVSFRPETTAAWGHFVAFKPAESLKQVTIEGIINNQNLHGETTPDMVIIYPKNFKEQAEKLAELHRSHDNFDVLTAEEELIFNEFSSGAQDATAYRLFLKMLYDRNPDKLKYLLLLGCGSYDNRRLNGGKSENQLLTYQSSDSHGNVSSYTTDDYFGFLADNSGKSIPTDILSISVGRIPAKTVEDAEAAITKTIDYIISDNPETWRSNILIMADQGDNNLHTIQAIGVEDTIRSAIGKALNIAKIYQEWYNISNLESNTNGTENWGRIRLESLLKEGVAYVSYIGHASAIAFTRGNRLWTSPKVQSVKYPYLPFFSLAACETAQFDNDGRSISEDIVLTPDGGGIGVLSAARTVYSTQNDKLNKALSELLFTLKEDGSYRTIGEAAMEAKKSFGTAYNYNKLSFTLFGDPAVKFRFPKNLCKITTINGIQTGNDSITLSPLSTAVVTGIVNDAAGIIDTSFNGDVTLTIYDKNAHYKTLTKPNTKETFESYYPREKLCHATGTVVDGKFSISITLPQNCMAANDTCLITAFAKSRDNRIISGCEERFTISPYDNSVKIDDNTPPVITSILIDGQNTDGNVYASSSPVISFEAADDNSINTKPDDIQGAMRLIIDNGKINIPSLSNYTQAENNGKSVKGSLSLHNLTNGKHTARLEISDMAGNTSSKEVIFNVIDKNIKCILAASSDVARTSIELVIDSDCDISASSLHIRDNANNIIAVKKNSGASFSWDLKDNSGNRVKPGRYFLFATFDCDSGKGVTAPISIIVLDEKQ